MCTRPYQLLILLILLVPQFLRAQTMLLPGDSVWSYLYNNTRPIGWETPSYNATGWSSGKTPLGDITYAGSVTTPYLPFGPATANKYVTTLFRKNFTITDLTGVKNFTLRARFDDGFILYINGVEVLREHIPYGPVDKSTLSVVTATPASIAPEGIAYEIPTCAFVEGNNLIAVEVHQDHPESTGLLFDLSLRENRGGSTPLVVRGPYLQAGSQTAISFRWRTDVGCKGRVRIGTANGSYNLQTVDETCSGTEHEIRVSGLSPDTKYFYQISSVEGQVFQGAADNFFRTAPPANTKRKISVAAFGDCGGKSIRYQQGTLSAYRNFLTANNLDAADAWILMGDNAYNRGTDQEFTTNFFDVYSPNLLKNHKLFPSPGNHDYGDSYSFRRLRSIPYFKSFTVPSNGECGGVASGDPAYYSFDMGNIHFLSLDSYGFDLLQKDMQTAGITAMKTWIEQDLAANDKKWIIAYWHHPPFTMGSHNSDLSPDLVNIREQFTLFLESKGIDMVICGHSHAYERSYLMKNYAGTWSSFSAPVHALSRSSATYTSDTTCPYVYNSTPVHHGTVYVVSGSAGADATRMNTAFGTGPMPFALNDGAVFYFEVEDNRLDAKLIRRDGTIFDRFTMMKDVNKSNTYFMPLGSTRTLKASWPAASYVWNNGAGNTRNLNVTNTSLETKFYSVSDQFGCLTDNFTVQTPSLALPTNVTQFQAASKGQVIKLKWVTSHEHQNNHFTLEKSNNGQDFSFLAKINGAGNSSVAKLYFFEDTKPSAGANFYRLSQTDLDGKVNHLGIRKVLHQPSNSLQVDAVIAATGLLKLEMNIVEKGLYQLQIVDMSGKRWHTNQLNLPAGKTNHQIQLPPGEYIWEVSDGKELRVFQKIMLR